MPQRPPEYTLELSDLVVGVRHNRFYVRSLRLGKLIHVTQNTMLHSRFAPNVCRFLLEVATDGCPYPSSFDWGSLSHSPFLPRLRYEKSILSLAGWHLRLGDIQPLSVGDEDEQWFVGLQQWRKRWHVPRYVYLTHLDHRLLLDLEHPLLAQELRSELQNVPKGGVLHVQEMLPDFEHLWLSDSGGAPYVAELVVPLTLQEPLAKKASKESHASSSAVLNEGRRYFPGDEWIYLKLYTCMHFHDPLIAGPLREIVSRLKAQGLCDLWFYVRYADPEPHLRVRFHTAQTSRSEELLREVLNWSRHHAREGLITRTCLDTYEREIERYGGPLCIDTIERCFSLNSDATSALIAAHAARQLTLDPLAIAVFSLDQLFRIWGYDFSSRLHYAKTRTKPNEFMNEFRRWRKLLTELLSPWRLSPTDEEYVQRDLLLKLLEPQAFLMSPLVSHIHQFTEQPQIHESLLSELAHMHLNRLLSIDNVREQRTYVFWCHTLESIGRRPSLP
jgi:thiopeptide-type bacteriocin biosynthesis protein